MEHYLEKAGEVSGAAGQVPRTGAHILSSARAAPTCYSVRSEVRAQLHGRGPGLRAL